MSDLELHTPEYIDDAIDWCVESQIISNNKLILVSVIRGFIYEYATNNRVLYICNFNKTVSIKAINNHHLTAMAHMKCFIDENKINVETTKITAQEKFKYTKLSHIINGVPTYWYDIYTKSSFDLEFDFAAYGHVFVLPNKIYVCVPFGCALIHNKESERIYFGS